MNRNWLRNIGNKKGICAREGACSYNQRYILLAIPAIITVTIMVNGKLSDARFQMLSDDYEKEQAELREKIDILEEEIGRQEDQTENVDKFIRQAKKYLYLEKLTPAVLNDLVKAVYVHAPDKSSGHRVQEVEISYNYIGILPATLLYDLQNEKTA